MQRVVHRNWPKIHFALAKFHVLRYEIRVQWGGGGAGTGPHTGGGSRGVAVSPTGTLGRSRRLVPAPRCSGL